MSLSGLVRHETGVGRGPEGVPADCARPAHVAHSALIPAFFLLLFGYALNFDIRHVRLAVEDNDGSAESRQLVSAFANSGYFDVVASPRSAEESSDS